MRHTISVRFLAALVVAVFLSGCATTSRNTATIAHPGVAGPLAGGAASIAAGSAAMHIDDSGSAKAIGIAALSTGAAALIAAGIIALAVSDAGETDTSKQATD